MLTCPHCHRQLTIVEPLTKRQYEVLVFLEHYVREHSFAPSLDEIAEHFGFASIGTVAEHLANLERKGAIHRDYNAARGITLLVRSDELGDVPSPDATGTP